MLTSGMTKILRGSILVKGTHGRKSPRNLLCYSANVPFSKVITNTQLIKVH